MEGFRSKSSKIPGGESDGSTHNVNSKLLRTILM